MTAVSQSTGTEVDSALAVFVKAGDDETPSATALSSTSSTENYSDGNISIQDANAVLDNNTANSEETSKLMRWFLSPKFFIGFLLLGLIIFVIVDSATAGHVPDTVDTVLDWIHENSIAGFFLFVLGK